MRKAIPTQCSTAEYISDTGGIESCKMHGHSYKIGCKAAKISSFSAARAYPPKAASPISAARMDYTANPSAIRRKRCSATPFSCAILRNFTNSPFASEYRNERGVLLGSAPSDVGTYAKEEIIKPENLVYKKPTLMNDNPMHYCPGCSHGVVHK